MNLDIKIVAQRALTNCRVLLQRWLPDGEIHGNEYVARNPTRNDNQPGSFKINIETGIWCDFATGDKGGDLVSLFAYLKKMSQIEAAREIAAQLGIGRGEKHKSQNTTSGSEQDVQWEIITPIPATAGKADPHPRYGSPSNTWTYRDPQGRPIGHACRFDLPDGRKVVLPLTYWEATRGTERWKQWCWKAFPVPRPLYSLHRLVAQPDAPVLVTEGEKAAEAARLIFPDYVIVTSPGGCKAVEKTDWSPLKGRRVIVIPDYDNEGRKYGDDVARLAREAGAKSVELLVWPYHLVPNNATLVAREGSPKKGYDLADAVIERWTPELVAERTDLFVAYPKSAEQPEPTSALQTLSMDSSPDEIEEALRAYVRAIGTTDKLKVATHREKAIRLLNELEIKRATSLVDAAIKTIPTTHDDSEEQGTAPCLSDIDPWPETVEGAVLLDEIVAMILKYVALQPHAAVAIALWVVHAHAIKAAFISPILALVSPVKRCGKTTVFKVISSLVLRPMMASNVTAATIFRAIEKFHPTLLIDEMDTFIRGNDELRGILNSGHSRTTGFVIRTVGDGHEPRVFSTFGAKAVALIGKLPSTMDDRSVVIGMRRRKPGEKISRMREDRLSQECSTLRRMCARWVEDHLNIIEHADPEIPDSLHDRAADNWRQLLAIADAAGDSWPDLARAAALDVSGEDSSPEDSVKVQLLGDIRDLFNREGINRLASDRIVSALGEMEERPWPEWKKGKQISKKQLAGLLKSFGIQPKNLKLSNGVVLKGYARDDFADVFSRYLPSQSATALPALKDKDLQQNQSATTLPPVADRNQRNLLENNRGSVVADRNGENEEIQDTDVENTNLDTDSHGDEEESE